MIEIDGMQFDEGTDCYGVTEIRTPNHCSYIDSHDAGRIIIHLSKVLGIFTTRAKSIEDIERLKRDLKIQVEKAYKEGWEAGYGSGCSEPEEMLIEDDWHESKSKEALE